MAFLCFQILIKYGIELTRLVLFQIYQNMSNKIAVIKTGGKQYKVQEGQIVKIEKLNVEAGETVKFDTLMTAGSEGENVTLGKPSLGELVEGTVIETGKDDKVTVVKYKSKTRYMKTTGHRQPYTKVEIKKIA